MIKNKIPSLPPPKIPQPLPNIISTSKIIDFFAISMYNMKYIKKCYKESEFCDILKIVKMEADMYESIGTDYICGSGS